MSTKKPKKAAVKKVATKATKVPKAEKKKETKEVKAEPQVDNTRYTEGSLDSQGTSTGTDSNTSNAFKNFRHHPEMENFYRFIYENDLRYEALSILDEIMTQKANQKAAKQAKAKAH